MTSVKVASISRTDLEGLEETIPTITHVKHLSSYNWIDSVAPTIAIPGCPPLWSPPKGTRKVPKDSGSIYIAQNAARHPESPLEPLFRALYTTHQSFDIGAVDLVTDRNNIRKLLSFINPSLSRNGLEPFTIEIEATSRTVMFCRAETETVRFVGPDEFVGFGHEFEKAYTRDKVSGSTGHHRIITYSFGGLRLIVRYETDGYVDSLSGSSAVGPDQNSLSSMMESLSLRPPKCVPCGASGRSKLLLRNEGQTVPADSILEIKTRVAHRPISMQEVLPQLWVSQTPNLVRAYHTNGVFASPKVECIVTEIKEWEESHGEDLRGLSSLFKKLIGLVKGNGGTAILRYDTRNDRLELWTAAKRKMLPDDLYFRLDHHDTEGVTCEKAPVGSGPSKTLLKIGNTLYNVDLSMIPYLASFVSFERNRQPQGSEFTHGDIPLFDTALQGLESGYRFCFRSLPVDLAQYHTLCETYDFLGVDVLGGQTIDNIFADLRACKTDYELDYKRYRAIKGDKTLARDAAFRLLFLILRGEFRDEARDSAKAYNAVLFIVSHLGTFKYRTRSVLRAAYEERFVVSTKQRARLDEWKKLEGDGALYDDKTTEDSSEPYYSDES
ncbi:hypothetical protein AFCA_011028 [Aspergillus flavus]|uniref:Geranylgeranyl pyrophosphate synthetase n=1 Tax=Aspergillus flavus TaxID=5059 RepID=A0AB74BUR3_ASPFL|nr:geranylgeranyl pyrophosphate synthetase [Aspergillus flavus]RAQ75366.1 geranylgeranyl pyrophosphate synthetase [Aspergillus flavus]RMZ38109.1 geranylgeranyl pyrophosphate synthetase [Aspergillus flavus]UDD63768.1 hypothetical protein AFCA_011028 [Aspergillus flavus]